MNYVLLEPIECILEDSSVGIILFYKKFHLNNVL